MKTYNLDAVPDTGGEDLQPEKEGDDLDPSPLNIEDKLFKQQLDTEFPLSGGETDEDLDIDIIDDEGIKDSVAKLDTEFPLSGGETDDDLL